MMQTSKWLFILILVIITGGGVLAPKMSTAEEGVHTVGQVCSPDKIINPHFTGKDCNICHKQIPEVGDSNARLNFNGDDIALCNSCHENEFLKGDLHPVGIVPPEGNRIDVPSTLPLYGGKITCRTCHNAYLQCQSDPSLQFINRNFLKDGPYKKTIDLCFRCHNQEEYKKTNPHDQIDETGKMLKDQCLYCHQSFPDPNLVAHTEEATFKTDFSTLCSACHGGKKKFHPAKTNHLQTPSQEILIAIEAAEKNYKVTLPLFKGDIFCGTCHNPHDKGIIKGETAAKGADAELRLRLNPAYDLCVACHSSKEDLAEKEVVINIKDKDLILPTKGDNILLYHKSYLERKCRACHRITRENPERPIVYKMCFQMDCHNTSLISETFKHSDAQKGNCLLCHNQHGSQYGAHIVNDQQRLCKSCHPLVQSLEENEKEEEKGKDYHDYYNALFRKFMPDQGLSCIYCHGEDHSMNISQNGIAPCYQCHNYIKNLIMEKKGGPRNIHDSLTNFTNNECTLCHNPHSSPYPYLLKDDPDSYK